MGDLERRNTEAMINETKRMHRETEELRDGLRLANEKINFLATEIQDLKQKLVLLAVDAQAAKFGSGGTVS